MRKWTGWLLIGLMITLVGQGLSAQETAAPVAAPPAAVVREQLPPAPLPVDREPAVKSKLDDRSTKELISAVMMGRLAKELNLKPEETAEMVRNFEVFKEKVQGVKRERAEMIKQLKASVAANASDDEVNPKLNKLIELDKNIASSRLDFYTSVSEKLTASQKAKLYFFVGEFENDMKKLMQNARERKVRQMRGERPGERVGDGADRMRERLKERGEMAKQRRNAPKAAKPQEAPQDVAPGNAPEEQQ